MTLAFRVHSLVACRSTQAVAVAVAILVMSTRLAAQGSPVDDLLKNADRAVDQLQYDSAYSIAVQVLRLGDRLTSQQRQQALMISAASAFAEETPIRRAEVALSALRQLVRTHMNFRLPARYTWSGLDSLLGVARTSALAVDVNVVEGQEATGATGTLAAAVRTSRSARLRAELVRAATGAVVLVDSTPPTLDGILRLVPIGGDSVIVGTGEYVLRIFAIDASARDSILLRYRAVAQSTRADLVAPPPQLSPSQLLPEREAPVGVRGVVFGLAAAGATALLAAAIRADRVASTVGADIKGFAIAGVVAGSVAVAVMRDRGRPLADNVVANEKMQQAYRTALETSKVENARRAAAQRVIMSFTRIDP